MLGTGAAGNYLFSANGMYDPNITGTGHQPIGFDQMMALYEQYTVVAAAVEVNFLPNNPARCGVYLSPDTSGLTSASQIIENGLANTKVFNGLTASATANNPFAPVTLNCDIASYFGRKTEQELLNDDQLYGTAAANPNEQVYFAVTGWQFNPDGSTSKSFTFDITLSYDVIFWEPKKLASS
jgi:hypothetical protein